MIGSVGDKISKYLRSLLLDVSGVQHLLRLAMVVATGMRLLGNLLLLMVHLLLVGLVDWRLLLLLLLLHRNLLILHRLLLLLHWHWLILLRI